MEETNKPLDPENQDLNATNEEIKTEGLLQNSWY